MDTLNEKTTMQTLNNDYPGARRALFAKYHIGGCSSCAYQSDESLAEVCSRHDLETSEVISHVLSSHEHDKQMLISPEDLVDYINSGKQLRLIDIRTREEHEAVTIPNSDFLTQDFQQKAFAEWDADTLVILYDHLGDTVLDQVAWFIGHTLKNTKGLEGGIDAYSQQVDSSLPRYRLELD